ncbi:hypothetical protein FOA43_002396 [Brettanomyces nanus]|uniref:Zn(2)-C6 fungal-type domain-containing protein n=1 Tax=Eeniella nana TaxID=13502 RepID=A0A875S0Y3_EENNA|nr:uncharacterized protein FOA43_002396 [Brettanomyces nanus]QPG75056.1 hypothetical protein FOA43_002396 [Brettanomyces nanus]
MLFVETIIDLEPAFKEACSESVTIDVTHNRVESRVESRSIRIDFESRTIETNDSFGSKSIFNLFADNNRVNKTLQRFDSKEFNYGYNQKLLNVFRDSPTRDVITPAKLMYRNETTVEPQQTFQSLFGVGMLDNLLQRAHLESIYDDVQLPDSWMIGGEHNDHTEEFLFEGISFKSENTEKLLANRNGFNPNDSKFRIASSLAGSGGIDYLEGISTRPTTQDFRIPVFNFNESMKLGMKEKKGNGKKPKTPEAADLPEVSINTDDSIDEDYREGSSCSIFEPVKRKKGRPKGSKNSVKKIRLPKKRGRKPKRETSEEPSIKKYKKTSGPRKKTGCWTCRLRRKKCTEERPECAECIRLGLTCQGYNKDRPVFMTNPSLAREMTDEIKKITLTQKRRGCKQRYEEKMRMKNSIKLVSQDATIDEPI